MFPPSRLIVGFSAMAAFSLCLVGCNEPVGEVSGKVTFKGAPVKTGSISFHMKSKGVAQDAKLDADGNFTMPAAMPTGTYQAYYVPPAPEPQDPRKGPVAAIRSPVPKRYTDLQTSGFSFEVSTGRNIIVVEFKD